MKLLRKLSILAAMAVLAVGAFAQGNPKDIIKELSQHRVTRNTEIRQSGKPMDQATFNAINAEVKAKAEAAVKDVDVSKVDPKDAYDWAQVFSIAERHKDVCTLSHKFLMSSPTPEQKFQAQILMMQSCNELGEAEMLIDTLRTTRPSTQMESSRLMSATMYADTIAKGKGVDAAVKVLDEVAATLVFEDPKVGGQRNFDAEKKRNEANPNAKALTEEEAAKRLEYWTTQAKASQDSMKGRFVEKKAQLLVDAKRKDEAIKALDTYIATLDPASPAVRSSKYFKTRLTLPGMAAPELNVERGYGGVKSLAELKGKVVIVDMFAHWCGPCIASFPSVRKMYDELKDKGLEIVGVTTYYGYYKTERPLDKDAEFARMADFMKDHNMNWPVIYGDRTNFDSYGVTGIPTVYIIDRQGKVHDLKVGYSPDSFNEFRAKVEKLLAQK